MGICFYPFHVAGCDRVDGQQVKRSELRVLMRVVELFNKKKEKKREKNIF